MFLKNLKLLRILCLIIQVCVNVSTLILGLDDDSVVQLYMFPLKDNLKFKIDVWVSE